MKHPTREEFMSYLYEELPAEQHGVLQSHLGTCADCSAQLKIWQEATREMDRWRLPARRKTARQTTVVRWAAAAAVVAIIAFGSARVVALNNEVKQLRAEMQRGFRRDWNAALTQASEQAVKSANAEAQALVAGVARRLEERRLLDQQATLAALQKLNARHTEDFAAMRKELETVAVFSEAGLQRTENELANIAYSPAFSNDNP